MQGFKEFILKGNVIELAVAVVIGGAFGAIVDAFVAGIIDPLIAQVGGVEDVADVTVGFIKIGLVIAAVLNFLIVAAVVYFALVLPMAKFKEAQARRKGITEDEAEETDIDVLREIRELLKAQSGQQPGAHA